MALSQFLNALIGGDPDESLSSRIGKIMKGITNKNSFLLVIIKIGNLPFRIWGEKDHWGSAIEKDEGNRALWKFKGEKNEK